MTISRILRSTQDDVEQTANAALISAAPDLLEALKAYQAFFVRYVNTSLEYGNLINQGATAIAKAEETK